jgi:hypothetical protein
MLECVFTSLYDASSYPFFIPFRKLFTHFRMLLHVHSLIIGTPLFVLIAARERGKIGAEEVVSLQTLYSVNVKRDALYAKLNHTNAPLSTVITVAQLKAAWEGLSL